MSVPERRQIACFFEKDADVLLGHRALAEFVGTALLMFAATGAGLSAARIFPGNAMAGLLLIAIAVGGGLSSLIVAFGAVSGGHYNPLITVLQWIARERTGVCTIGYVMGQLAGGLVGGYLATMIFAVSPTFAVAQPLDASLLLSECFAAASLMSIVFACARSHRVDTGPFAVGAWVAAGIVATPSGFYANPAIAIGALVASGPLALPLRTAVAYAVAEAIGGLIALAFVSIVLPSRNASPPKISPSTEAAG